MSHKQNKGLTHLICLVCCCENINERCCCTFLNWHTPQAWDDHRDCTKECRWECVNCLLCWLPYLYNSCWCNRLPIWECCKTCNIKCNCGRKQPDYNLDLSTIIRLLDSIDTQLKKMDVISKQSNVVEQYQSINPPIVQAMQ